MTNIEGQVDIFGEVWTPPEDPDGWRVTWGAVERTHRPTCHGCILGLNPRHGLAARELQRAKWYRRALSPDGAHRRTTPLCGECAGWLWSTVDGQPGDPRTALYHLPMDLFGDRYDIGRLGVEGTKPRRLARNTDPDTSRRAAEAVAPRTGTQKHHLLVAYSQAPHGLTDRQASAHARLEEGWKRCADLRRDGLIEPVLDADGEPVLVDGGKGTEVMICRITPTGLAAVTP